jgi:hypothetical protein
MSAEMDERTRRIGLNEALAREVNERIESLARKSWNREIEILCECGDEDCTVQLPVSLDEYERVREDATLFLVIPGHEAPDVEDVVDSFDRSDVVRKRDGAPARIAAATDRRS